MLSHHLKEALCAAFPALPFVFDEPPTPVATLAAPSPALDPLQICDDGDEAIVYLGNVTHAHLGCHDEALSEEAKQQQIAADVVQFVRDLFADRIVASSTLGGRIGGWRTLAPGEALPGPSMLSSRYVWSRPLQ